MTSESMALGRRNAVLVAAIGAVLAGYSGGASALEFEFDNGARLNWNTTISVGASWRAQDPSKQLYTLGDASLIGKYTGNYTPGTELAGGNGRAGNWAAGESTLNYDQYDMFSAPVKLISDIELKKGGFGGLVRFKAWYDYALENNKVNIGNQANNMNGARELGPTPPNCASTSNATAFACIPLSSPGFNRWPDKKLSDSGFEDEQKFSNIYLLDAYIYGTVPIGDTSLQVRLGNQVINWGESVFIQGVNQINPIDVPAARRAGAELKEILLPIWAAYINWGLPFGSLEAFYQLKWNNTSIDGCGTYWGVTSSIISTDAGKCNSGTAFGGFLGSPLAAQFGSAAWLQAEGLYVPLGKGKEPSDNGQYGIALRFPVEKLDTEFGLYAMNIHSRLPVISSHAGTSANDLTPQQQAALGAVGLWSNACGPAFRGGACYRIGTNSVTAAIPIVQYNARLAGQAILGAPIELESPYSFWEYPEDIQIYGLSTASNFFGWSISSELSYHADVPVQINGNDLLQGAFLLNGPNRAASYDAYAAGTGAILQGWERYDKTQFQVNGVKTYSNILGADNVLIVGEVGMQWNDLPNYKKDTVRYGRGFMWGYGSGPGYAYSIPPTAGDMCSPTLAAAPAVASPIYNPSPRGCKNNGYITDTAWGYRLRISADYLNVGNSGITMTPSIFWSQDVDGISMDPAFQEDKTVLGLGMKFTYNKKYVFDVNYVTYADSGYDPLQDRDFYSVSASVTF